MVLGRKEACEVDFEAAIYMTESSSIQFFMSFALVYATVLVYLLFCYILIMFTFLNAYVISIPACSIMMN